MFNLQRPLTNAGVFAVGSYALGMALGVTLSLGNIVESAAILGAATLASDTVHDYAHMYPTGITSAVGVGLMNVAAHKVLRGDNDYISNGIAGFLTDFGSGPVMRIWNPPQESSGNVTDEEGAVSTA